MFEETVESGDSMMVDQQDDSKQEAVSEVVSEIAEEQESAISANGDSMETD